jgi:hypothetical protein
MPMPSKRRIKRLAKFARVFGRQFERGRIDAALEFQQQTNDARLTTTAVTSQDAIKRLCAISGCAEFSEYFLQTEVPIDRVLDILTSANVRVQ